MVQTLRSELVTQPGLPLLFKVFTKPRPIIFLECRIQATFNRIQPQKMGGKTVNRRYLAPIQIPECLPSQFGHSISREAKAGWELL